MIEISWSVFKSMKLQEVSARPEGMILVPGYVIPHKLVLIPKTSYDETQKQIARLDQKIKKLERSIRLSVTAYDLLREVHESDEQN